MCYLIFLFSFSPFSLVFSFFFLGALGPLVGGYLVCCTTGNTSIKKLPQQHSTTTTQQTPNSIVVDQLINQQTDKVFQVQRNVVIRSRRFLPTINHYFPFVCFYFLFFFLFVCLFVLTLHHPSARFRSRICAGDERGFVEVGSKPRRSRHHGDFPPSLPPGKSMAYFSISFFPYSFVLSFAINFEAAKTESTYLYLIRISLNQFNNRRQMF